MTVTLYTVKDCPYCDDMRSFLKNESISFREVDLAKTTKEDARGLVDKIPANTDLAVPMIEVNGDLLYGAGPYNKNFIKCKVKQDANACRGI